MYPQRAANRAEPDRTRIVTRPLCLNPVLQIGSLSRETTQRVRGHSIFSLALRGDTPGSDRWQNAIVAGAIPVAVRARALARGPHVLLWDEARADRRLVVC